MRADETGGVEAAVIRADGGMSASDYTRQSVADMIDAPVDRPAVLETTALGAGYLAGLQCGLFPPPDDFARMWKLERRFSPTMAPERRDAIRARAADFLARMDSGETV